MWRLGRGDLVDGRYRIEREIGAGGMAHVYAARDEELGDTVALKIIRPELASDPELGERFRREVRIARQVNHPNVVRIFEFGRASLDGKEVLYLTMELLSGRDLSEWRRRRGDRLPYREVLDLALQICDGLDAAHRVGVVHRDVKPHNVFVDDSGRARLMDFGISRLATLDGLTRGSQSVGTPHYMSPEQVSGKNVDLRTDIYAVGVMLYELSTGRLPFEGTNPVEIALRHLQESPVPPRRLDPGFPAELNRILLTCLEKEPGDRFSSVAELREALEGVGMQGEQETVSLGVLGGGDRRDEPTVRPTVTLRDENVTTRRRRARGRSTARWLLAAAAVLAVAAVAGYRMRSTPPESEPSIAAPAENASELPVDTPTTTASPPSSPERRPPAAAASPAAAPSRASEAAVPIRISANPGTEIFLDGNAVGTVPPVVELSVPPGRHRIRYRIPDYDEHEEAVAIRAGAANVFSHHFPPYGVLRIVAQPYARVHLDGEDMGFTPLNLPKARSGERRLVLEREGYRTIETTVAVKPGEINTYRFDLER